VIIRSRYTNKDRQRNGQKTDNSMAKRQTTQGPKDRQLNGQKTDNSMAKTQTTQWPKVRKTKKELQYITQNRNGSRISS
jgi:hypothetical protein